MTAQRSPTTRPYDEDPGGIRPNESPAPDFAALHPGCDTESPLSHSRHPCAGTFLSGIFIAMFANADTRGFTYVSITFEPELIKSLMPSHSSVFIAGISADSGR